jgi:hypothetical protein
MTVRDAEDIVRRCDNCQKHCNYTKTSTYEIQLLPPVWPIARWGIDIVGQLPTTPGKYKYAIVAMEYFSKWIEARVVPRITSQVIQKFFWKSIACRFGVPYKVTMDNGKQFDNTDFRRFCFNLGTKLCFTSVYHPVGIS